jgi:hypothetical protein
MTYKQVGAELGVGYMRARQLVIDPPYGWIWTERHELSGWKRYELGYGTHGDALVRPG